MKARIIKATSLAVLVGVAAGLLPGAVLAAGIVPCGESSACNICDLLNGIYKLIDWGKNVLVVVAIVAIFFAGVMYIISAGDSSMMQTAKGFLTSALVGFAIFLGAWLIIYITMTVLSAQPDSIIEKKSWNTFDCKTSS